MNNSVELLCAFEPPDWIEQRFWLVTVVGSTLSLFSIVENAFLFLLFITSHQHRDSPSLYLLLLAFFDIFMSVAYITLIAGRVFTEYAESVKLWRLWTSYVIPMMVISHIAMTSSSFLIVFATFERYCITLNNRYVKCLQRHRIWIALSAVLIGIVSHGTILWEIDVVHQPECLDTMKEHILAVTSLVEIEYYKWWRFWFRSIFTILLPFFYLAYLNARVLIVLNKTPDLIPVAASEEDIQLENYARQRKARVKAATRTLVLVVCTYLLSKVLSVCVTIWEYIDALSLFTRFLDFYVWSVDTVSLLTIAACALRLPIYMSCQPALRSEMRQFFKHLFIKRKPFADRRMTLVEGRIPMLLKNKRDSEDDETIKNIKMQRIYAS